MTLARAPVPFVAGLLAPILALLPAGCASTSTARDVALVGALAGNAVIGDLAIPAAGAERDALVLPQEPLDAESAVQIALRHNPELRARLRELGIGRGRLVQAGSVANPVVEVEALPERDTAIEVRLEHDLSSLVLAPARARVAAAELDADRHDVAAAVVRLSHDVRSAVVDLQAAEQRLAIAREVLGTFAAGRELAEGLRAAGNVSSLVAATEVAAHERARAELGELELAVIEGRARVQRLLGLGGEELPWQVAAELPGVPEELAADAQADLQAVRGSHELASLESRRAAAAARGGLTRLEGWLPDITVDVHALRVDADGGGDPSWRFGAGLALRVPLFDQRRGASRAHQAERDALQDRQRGLAGELRAATRAARARLALAHGRVRQLRDRVLPAQDAVAREALLHYNAMQLGLPELLRARREQLAVRLAYVDAQHDFWRADAALRALLGGVRVDPGAGRATAPSITRDDPRGGH